MVLAHTWDWEPSEASTQANLEETEVFVQEDSQRTDFAAQEDWEIPF